jgi:hypothetical protein
LNVPILATPGAARRPCIFSGAAFSAPSTIVQLEDQLR